MGVHPIIGAVAAGHVETVAGFVAVFRNIVEAMSKGHEKGEMIQPGEVAGWVEQLDFIGNALSNANDTAIDTLRESGLDTVLCVGWSASRPTPVG